MCCFSPVSAPLGLLGRLFRRSPPPVAVANTRIFARMLGGEQALIYSMKLSVAGDVAMILPLPVVARGGDAAVSFVDLSAYPTLFTDLDAAFPELEMLALKGGLGWGSQPEPRPKLVVHIVGAFEASYVPSRGDFDRLDPRFRLPDSVWAAMTTYADWGFAVFQLARGRNKTIQPMAFRFRTRFTDRLFFPTVHVHDGVRHPTAEFAHHLYYQHDGVGSGHDEVSEPLGRYVRIANTAGLVADARLARRAISGSRPNEDTWIALPAPVDQTSAIA